MSCMYRYYSLWNLITKKVLAILEFSTQQSFTLNCSYAQPVLKQNYLFVLVVLYVKLLCVISYSKKAELNWRVLRRLKNTSSIIWEWMRWWTAKMMIIVSSLFFSLFLLIAHFSAFKYNVCDVCEPLQAT